MNIIFECKFCGKQSHFRKVIIQHEAEHRAAIHKQNADVANDKEKTCEICGAPTHSKTKRVCDKCASGYEFWGKGYHKMNIYTEDNENDDLSSWGRQTSWEEP